MPRWTSDMLTELAALRYEQGIRRNDAAYNFRLSIGTIERYENGSVSLPLEVADAMADYYGVPFEEVCSAARAVRQKWLEEHPK